MSVLSRLKLEVQLSVLDLIKHELLVYWTASKTCDVDLYIIIIQLISSQITDMTQIIISMHCNILLS